MGFEEYLAEKMQERECSCCHEKFKPKVPQQIYCSEQCQKQKWYEQNGIRQGERKRQAKKERIAAAMARASGQPVKTINDWAREAAECNLDYGNYRALIAAGKTYEELKASAVSRPITAHASNHKWI